VVPLGALPVGLSETRASLHRVAAHILARARHAETGRLDLVPTPAGFGTPAFGPNHTVLRVSGTFLVVERTLTSGGTTHSMVLDGASLAEVSEFVGLTLDPGFSVGHDTPPFDPMEALHIDASATVAIGVWFAFASGLIDVVTSLRPGSDIDRLRLWPEHFDLGLAMDAASTARVNIGASPGDDEIDEPYLYLAPWGDARPGGVPDGYWNASFGAVLTHGDVVGSPDATTAALRFWRAGLDAFSV
jgi:hypothetical protein